MTNAKMSAFRVAVLYAAAVVAIYVSITGVISTGGGLPLLLLVPLLALLLPPLRDRLGPLTRFLPGLPGTLVTALMLVIFQGLLFGSHAENAKAEKDAQLKQAAKERMEKVRADLAAEYTRDKPQILAQVEAHLAANQPGEALAAVNKYFVANKDPDLARLQARATLAAMKLELKNEAAVPLSRRQEIYTALMKDEPGARTRYQAKLKAVTAELELEYTARARAAERTALEASVKSQFSPWDGSHRQVERELKARMKNPASYEHVETRYRVGTDSITVFTTYRGTNSFGAVVPSEAIATVDKAGNVLTLEDR